jgi:5'-3' exonuclease
MRYGGTAAASMAPLPGRTGVRHQLHRARTAMRAERNADRRDDAPPMPVATRRDRAPERQVYEQCAIAVPSLQAELPSVRA